MKFKILILCITIFSTNLVFAADSSAPTQEVKANDPAKALTFFVTSEGVGKGADLGGLAGADAHCQRLATAVGAGNKTWRAYLSTQTIDGQPAVNARDRIGKGPWYNVKGAVVAKDIASLHGDTLDMARLGNNLSRTTALTEKGESVKGAGDKPNQHDILTGSLPDGTHYVDGVDHTLITTQAAPKMVLFRSAISIVLAAATFHGILLMAVKGVVRKICLALVVQDCYIALLLNN